MSSILVFNPNSNAEVTAFMAQSIDSTGLPDDINVQFETFSDGPYGIETQDDIDAVINPVVNRCENGCEDAFVIACYSDPGVSLARRRTSKPVIGIQEAAVREAQSSKGKFGVIALSEASVARHLPYLKMIGAIDRLAAERVANLTVAESAEGGETFEKLQSVSEQLRDTDGARTIILGCTGMSRHRALLEDTVGISVIDPVQAAVRAASLRV